MTLVRNLEVFGINLKEFSKECQKIGASATIVNEPGQKVPSVLVQGNQVLHVHKLLTGEIRFDVNSQYCVVFLFLRTKYDVFG